MSDLSVKAIVSTMTLWVLIWLVFLSKDLTWWWGKRSKVDLSEMRAVQLEMHEMHKTGNFHSNLLVSLELVTEGYKGRPVKCKNFKRPLPGIIIPWLHFGGNHCSPLSGISANHFWSHKNSCLKLLAHFKICKFGKSYLHFSWIVTFHWIVIHLCTNLNHGCLTSVMGRKMAKSCHWPRSLLSNSVTVSIHGKIRWQGLNTDITYFSKYKFERYTCFH